MNDDLLNSKVLAVCFAIILLLMFASLCGCSHASAKQLEDAREGQAMQTFMSVVSDKPIPQHVIEHSDSAPAAAVEIVDESASNAECADETDESEYVADSYDEGDYSGLESFAGTYYAEYSELYNADGPSRTMPGWHDGYLETYYNASSHYLASTWTLDDEGFYRDENGRYVIGVDVSHQEEMPYGTVVETGKGEAVVYDYGSGAEVHDFAVNW